MIRVLVLGLISITPFNRLRIFLYRLIFKFKIDYKSKVGFLNLLNCKQVELNNAKIGFLNQLVVDNLKMEEKSIIKKFNRMKHINELSLSKEAKIDSKNFIGGPCKNTLLIGADYKQQNIHIGERSSVLRSNYFDVVREVNIGTNVIFGGNGSEIWTHGFDTKRTFLYGSVEFGNNIFIGSNCIFTKGISVYDEVSIASGSVIYKSILETGFYTSHRIVKVK